MVDQLTAARSDRRDVAARFARLVAFDPDTTRPPPTPLPPEFWILLLATSAAVGALRFGAVAAGLPWAVP